MMYRVGIVDDHLLFAEALATMLRAQGNKNYFTIIKPAGQTIEEIESKSLNVILLDLNMPDINGMDLLRNIKKKYNEDVKIIIVTTRNDLFTLRQALKNGANGFCTKNTPASELIFAIETVNTGNQYISQEMRNVLSDEIETKDTNDNNRSITEREKEVLILLQKGFSSREIANKLFISEHTVASHRKNLLAKLDASSTIEMINTAQRKGWI